MLEMALNVFTNSRFLGPIRTRQWFLESYLSVCVYCYYEYIMLILCHVCMYGYHLNNYTDFIRF
jgi:hypothetical protein